MSLTRTIKHWILSPIPVKYSFPTEALAEIESLIASAEQKTSSEFLVIVERSLPMSYVRRDAPNSQRAQMLFGKYRCWDTEDNNGVLIYLNLSDHGIEIVLDRGAARLFTQVELDNIVLKMGKLFKEKKWVEGVKVALDALTPKLSEKFPNKPVDNPLPNNPVLL